MEETTGFMDWLSELVKDFSFANFIPKLNTVLGWVETFSKLAVLAGPVLILVLGLIYWFCPPKEANHRLGYRFWWGMGSVEAWQFTQRVAGILWSCMGFLLSIIMLLVCGGFSPSDGLDMVSTAGTCLIWELVLIGGLCLFIDVVVILRYDRKGNRRPKVAFTIPDKFLSFPKPKAEKPQAPQSPDLPQQ